MTRMTRMTRIYADLIMSIRGNPSHPLHPRSINPYTRMKTALVETRSIPLAELYRQYKHQAKEYPLAAFTVSVRVAVVDRRPFNPPPQNNLLQSTADKQKETDAAQNQFRRGSKVACQRKRRQYGETSWKIQSNKIERRASARTILPDNYAQSAKGVEAHDRARLRSILRIGTGL